MKIMVTGGNGFIGHTLVRHLLNEGNDVKVLDIGGGTPVFYGTPVVTPEEIGLLVSGKLNALSETLGCRFTLIIESGRYLAAEAAMLGRTEELLWLLGPEAFDVVKMAGPK